MRVLVLGASGMLGHAMISMLAENEAWDVFGTLRSATLKRFFPEKIVERLEVGVDVEHHESLLKVFEKIRPDIVINCVGLVKQLPEHEDPLLAFPINAILPHRLANLCSGVGAKLIHISTDCVFAGTKGGYVEDDPSDATELYGKSKFLGEVYYPHTITLRTSIIGHELQRTQSLIEWFLSQDTRCKGYRQVIFSGLPTVELARIVRDFVIPRPMLSGLYHIAAKPISKYDLLKLVAKVYQKSIEIEPDDQYILDRSLNAERFSMATGYIAPEWPDLVELMHAYQ